MASPAADLAAIVGEVDGEIACCQICLSQRVRIGREVVSRIRSTDFAVRPAFRGRSLATELATFKSGTVPLPTLRLTESNAAAIQHLTRKSGGVPLGNPVGQLHLALDWWAPVARDGGALRAARSIVEAPSLRLATEWQRRRSGGPAAPVDGVALRRIDRFDRRIGELWREAERDFEVAVERTPEYLDWRYCDERGGRWTVEVAEQDDRAIGYIAWRVEKSQGVIGDLVVLPERHDVLAALAQAAVTGAAAAGAASVIAWLPGIHPYRSVLRDLGFVSRPAGVEQMFRPQLLSTEAAELLAAPQTRIHFTIGDSDYL